MSTALVPTSEFGPLQVLVVRAHRLYVDGFSEQAVRACREGVIVSTSAGDRTTTRFLRYVEGVALQELVKSRMQIHELADEHPAKAPPTTHLKPGLGLDFAQNGIERLAFTGQPSPHMPVC